MASSVRRLLVCSVMLSLIGCSRTIVKPRLVSPGPAAYQQDNAVDFVDPYPPNDMGPEMVGARPPDFAVPRNEVTRAKAHLDQRGGRTIVAPLPIATPPSPLY